MSTKPTDKMKTAKIKKDSKPTKKTKTQHATARPKRSSSKTAALPHKTSRTYTTVSPEASPVFFLFSVDRAIPAELGVQSAACSVSDVGMTAYMVNRLLESSDYDFSDLDVRFRRRPDLDTDDGVAIEIVVEKGVDGETESYTIVEMFVTMAYCSFTDSVKEFDRHARLMSYINLPLKEEKKTELKPKIDKPAEKKARPDGSAKKRPAPRPLRVIKECLVRASKYRIPVKRFQIVVDHVDTKSRKYVYELRFFQKDCSKNPGQPYEPAILRIGFGDDDFVRIAKRFDKIVEGLRFNTFDLKK